MRIIRPLARRSPRRGAGPAPRPTRAPAAERGGGHRAGREQAGAAGQRRQPQAGAVPVARLQQPAQDVDVVVAARVLELVHQEQALAGVAQDGLHDAAVDGHPPHPGAFGVGLEGQADRLERRLDRSRRRGRSPAARPPPRGRARAPRGRARRAPRRRASRPSSRARAGPRRGRRRRAGRRSGRPARRRRGTSTRAWGRGCAAAAPRAQPRRGCPRSAPSPRAPCRLGSS